MERLASRSPGRDKDADPLTLIPLEGADREWDEFVRQAPGASFCHLAGWRQVIGDGLGHECIYSVAVDSEGEWQGVLPLVGVRSAIFGHYLLSMPFLNYGGPLGTGEACRLLCEDATRVAQSRGVDLLEVRSRHGVPPSPLRLAERKITVVLDLPDDAEVLWEEVLRSKVRSQIRRSMKEDMTVRFGPDQMQAFYEVFARHMRDLGTPVLPRHFFGEIVRAFPEEAQFGCVYHGEIPVAGGCGFVWRDEFEMTWASSLRTYNRQAPNMLLYWSFMERMVNLGLHAFNFGRCSPDSGTHRFKRQWGGRDETLPWGQWSPGSVSETPNPNRPLYQLATKVWSKLPLPIANRLGPTIARRLP